MAIIILPDAAKVGRVAALKITSVVDATPSAVLGLATGSSPTAIHAALAVQRAQGGRK